MTSWVAVEADQTEERNTLEGNVYLWGKQLNSDKRSGYFKYPLLPFSASQYQGATMQLHFDHLLYNHTSSSAGETQTENEKHAETQATAA